MPRRLTASLLFVRVSRRAERKVPAYLAVWLLVLCLFLSMVSFAQAQSDQRCFAETGFCISGRIRQFWERNGGLPVFGFPIGPQHEEVIEGRSFQVQQFERNRLELHPENARPFDVLLGRLGADRLAQQGRDWRSEAPRETAQSACRFFPETGFNVCGEILQRWRANGLEFDGRSGKSVSESLALFGLPLGPLHNETLSDGRSYQVQWFERARFELHPQNAPPYNVQLGLLGNETSSGSPPPAASPSNPSVCLSAEEARLATLINNYRAERGLPAVPVSVVLTRVAQLHVRDLHDHRPDSGTDSRGMSCNLHSWSNQGAWSAVCYTSDHKYAEGMWNKPREISGNAYRGNGFENAFAIYGADASADLALQLWKESPGHNGLIVEQGIWAGQNWPAMGVGIYKGYAVLWFGDQRDAQGSPGQCGS